MVFFVFDFILTVRIGYIWLLCENDDTASGLREYMTPDDWGKSWQDGNSTFFHSDNVSPFFLENAGRNYKWQRSCKSFCSILRKSFRNEMVG